MAELAIVGNYTGIHNSPVFQMDREIWGFGGRGPTLPRLDVLLQLHLPYAWQENPGVENWLKKNKTVPVYMRQRYHEFPMSMPYPFERAFALLDGVWLHDKPLRFYFTSSIAFAIALAILQGRERIEFWGIELRDHEYEEHKDCITFWQGFAAGRGIQLDIHCMEPIYRRPLYGAQREP